jgi:hypothetical protein
LGLAGTFNAIAGDTPERASHESALAPTSLRQFLKERQNVDSIKNILPKTGPVPGEDYNCARQRRNHCPLPWARLKLK